jgi:hypothetical protein
MLSDELNQHPLLGEYTLPTIRCSPHPLCDEAWKPFQEILTRHEFDAVLKVLDKNQEVLDVGSGYGGT